MDNVPATQVARWGRRFVTKPVFLWVVSLANMLYIAVHTHNWSGVGLHAAHITLFAGVVADWQPTETPYFPHNVDPQVAARGGERGHPAGTDARGPGALSRDIASMSVTIKSLLCFIRFILD